MKRTNLTKQEFLELTKKAIENFHNSGTYDKRIYVEEGKLFDVIIEDNGNIYGKYGTFHIEFTTNKDNTYNVYMFEYSFYPENEWYLTEEDIDNDFEKEEEEE